MATAQRITLPLLLLLLTTAFTWSHGDGPFTSTTTGLMTADGYYVGPGCGATITAWRGQGPQGQDALVVRWDTAYTWGCGMDATDPTHGITWLEVYPFPGRAAEMAGATLRIQYTAYVAGCCTQMVPIAWVNWKNGDYQIVACATFPLYGLDRPTRVDCTVQLPPSAGHTIDSSNYVAWGIDWPYLTAPTIVLYDVDVQVIAAAPVTIAPTSCQAEIDLLAKIKALIP